MRTYFEKPRTVVGWKGLISDPDLNGSYRVNHGLELARRLLLQVNELGVPTATEFLDMVTGQFIADLISWGAIGARTTESQIHRKWPLRSLARLALKMVRMATPALPSTLFALPAPAICFSRRIKTDR
ncbi:3-deoxy-D-arabinoheptulosonate-7-phosphate synthase [Salmonella enterica subsp. arizonae]|uniref:Phospho-2-dehydro-3-deoxyheptonate aldolase, Trp-sensitive n=1 Tax=Salmonella enterica subsp. arizonae TaxID=59203 RepID=A0A379SJH0_SALER|nr:3-deoxy-D-arabinoheptulosonate-7-phosphate synthase [Salmonella enterica subsp. arizonae]